MNSYPGSDLKVSLADLANSDRIFFSWYTFEKMFEDGKSSEILKGRKVIATTKQNVQRDGFAAMGVSVDDDEIGREDATLLIDSVKSPSDLGRTDIKIPPIIYWVNCQNAERLGITIPPEVLKGASEQFSCP